MEKLLNCINSNELTSQRLNLKKRIRKAEDQFIILLTLKLNRMINLNSIKKIKMSMIIILRILDALSCII